MAPALPGRTDDPAPLKAENLMRRTGLTRRALPCLAAAVLCALTLAPAAAQSVTSATAGQFTGPDRLQRLADGAKKEGTLTLYSSTALEDMTPLVSAFEKKYGVKVRLW